MVIFLLKLFLLVNFFVETMTIFYILFKFNIIIIRNVFFEHQISILEWFLKDHVTQDWSNDAENSALHHKNKLYFKIDILNVIFYNVKFFSLFLIK